MDPPRILVVEDAPVLIEALGAALCPPYRVLVAQGGTRALVMLQAQPVGLIILDLDLGEEDGLDLLPRLRAQSAAPVLILAAFGTHEHLVRIVRAKPDDYLEKPFNVPELQARVAALLDGGAPGADPVARVRGILEREYARRVSVAALARRVGVSPRRLQREFKHRYGVTPAAFLAACRMRRAAVQLQSTPRLVKEIAVGVGFPNPNNFATAFKRHHGVSPRVFRAR